MNYLSLFVFIVIFSCASCAKKLEVEQKEALANKPKYGWFDGRCFASIDATIPFKTKIFVIGLDDPQFITTAEVVGRATVENCGPLSDDRREQNEAQGYSFYVVNQKQPFGLAIGIIADKINSRVKNGEVLTDLDNDGNVERFSFCATSEGLSFDIWESPPYQSEALWSGYYFLGYDVERNCP